MTYEFRPKLGAIDDLGPCTLLMGETPGETWKSSMPGEQTRVTLNTNQHFKGLPHYVWMREFRCLLLPHEVEVSQSYFTLSVHL